MKKINKLHMTGLEGKILNKKYHICSMASCQLIGAKACSKADEDDFVICRWDIIYHINSLRERIKTYDLQRQN
jgi:hypothetical protein